MGRRDGTAWSDSDVDAEARDAVASNLDVSKMRLPILPEVAPKTRRSSSRCSNSSRGSEQSSGSEIEQRSGRHRESETETSDIEGGTRSNRRGSRSDSSYHGMSTCTLIIAGLCLATNLLGALTGLGILRLPDHEQLPAGTPAKDVRVMHISLAGTDRKIRYGVARETNWQAFLHNIQERLDLEHLPARVETNEGMLIRSEADLQHRDSLVIYEAEPEQSAAVEAWALADVVAFFEELELGQYTGALQEHALDGPMLLEVVKDDATFVELGIHSKLHMSKIRSRLKAVRR